MRRVDVPDEIEQEDNKHKDEEVQVSFTRRYGEFVVLRFGGMAVTFAGLRVGDEQFVKKGG
jgi:hypothetical protein